MTMQDRTEGISGLFDLSFTRFVTVSVIKIVYLLGMALIALAVLVMIISGFTQGAGTGFLMLIVAPILGFLQLLMLRIWLELIISVFRIAQNTTIMADSVRPTGGFPVMPVDQNPPPAPGL